MTSSYTLGNLIQNSSVASTAPVVEKLKVYEDSSPAFLIVWDTEAVPKFPSVPETTYNYND